jgi:hypothetical protein
MIYSYKAISGGPGRERRKHTQMCAWAYAFVPTSAGSFQQLPRDTAS